jgi:hypothetical protein
MSGRSGPLLDGLQRGEYAGQAFEVVEVVGHQLDAQGGLARYAL